jgi:DNA-binding response OmpR family regulator
MQARVLVLDDDEGWLKTVREVLTRHNHWVVGVTSVADALSLLEKSYFNVGVVDLRLDAGDESDNQGMAFMRALRERGLEEMLPCIVLTAYGNSARVRQAFRDFQVVDFLEKVPFQPAELLEAVTKSLKRNSLDGSTGIEIAGGGQLPDLWQRLTWADREDPHELATELSDLLRRLFPDADHLFIKELAAGQSGAGVVEVHPYYAANSGTPAVVKFGKRDKIVSEVENYRAGVERFVSSLSSTRLRSATGRVLGAVSYHLVGAELKEVVSFADFYFQHEVRDILPVLDNLFNRTCARWYDNREQPRRDRNLYELYTQDLHIEWDEIWRSVAGLGVDLSSNHLTLPGLPGRFANPQRWLDEHRQTLYLPVWRAYTHGDLNEHNILVAGDGRCWLIDFYRTGIGHILRDVIELETAVKFSLAPTASLVEHRQMEEHLLRQVRLDQPVMPRPRAPQRKTLAVVGHLRSLAAAYNGASKDINEYLIGLLFTTLNLLRLPTTSEVRLHALMSASLLCDSSRQL